MTETNKGLWIDVGRQGYERVGFDWDKETGVGIAGSCGSGKSNVVYRLLEQLLGQREDMDIHIYSKKRSFFYSKLEEDFEQVVETERKLHKIRSGMNKLGKEIDRRKRRMEKWDKSYEELKDYRGEYALGDWKEKVIVLDGLSVNLTELRKQGKHDQAEKHIELMEKLVYEGAKVGMKVIAVFIRNVESDAPNRIVSGLSVLGSTENNFADYDRWGLFLEDTKVPQKTGEMFLKTSEGVSFVKTYNIQKYAASGEGLFSGWDPYKGLYLDM